MKQRIWGVLTAVAMMVQLLPCMTTNAAEETLVDSGIDYTETVKTIQNPGAGYTSTLWYTCKPGNTPVYAPTGNLVLMFIDIGAFSSGVNGTTDEDGTYTEGTDYDLDESFFEGIRGTLENCRQNGCTVALRFRYDASGKTNPEPASFEKVLSHIQQIGDSGILEEYEDILMYVESGFVGAWGEQHSGKYTSLEYKAKVLDAMLQIVPKTVPVTVRTPNTFCTWAGITTSELSSYVAEEDSDAARVGLYNDGYMGSNTDLGTFISPNRETSVQWMKTQMLHTYYGGEFSGAIEYAQSFDTYLPENAIQEMYDTHLSYINSNIWSLYKDYTFDSTYDTSGADNSAYYGQTVYQFIRDHIGYRFVLRDSKLSADVAQGDVATVEFTVENTGFANPIKEQNAQVILEKDGYYYITDTEIDDRTWYSTETATESLSLKLPDNLETGDWKVYLKLSSGSVNSDSNARTVAFANADVYNSALGANLLGTLHVTASDQRGDNTFQELNAGSVGDGILHTYRDNIAIDGVMSEYEWDDRTLVAENDDSKLYLSCDDSYLYICATIPDTATSPVYNLQMQGTDDASKYWYYLMSNGYVYFNGSDSSGIVCKHSGSVVEFQVPLGTCMNLYDGKVLSFLRVSVQDSSNSWAVTADIRTENYTIQVPEVVETPIITETTTTETTATIESTTTTTTFMTTTQETTDSLPPEIEEKQGDINGDGNFSVADLVLFQKWLLGEPVTLENWQAGDLCQDNILNGLDLSYMRQLLISE